MMMMMMKLKLICQHFLIVVTDFALLWHAKQLKMCLHSSMCVRMCLKARVCVLFFSLSERNVWFKRKCPIISLICRLSLPHHLLIPANFLFVTIFRIYHCTKRAIGIVFGFFSSTVLCTNHNITTKRNAQLLSKSILSAAYNCKMCILQRDNNAVAGVKRHRTHKKENEHRYRKQNTTNKQKQWAPAEW